MNENCFAGVFRQERNILEVLKMTIKERADIAENLKATGQCNCCQAVTKVFADAVNVDEATLQKM